MRRIYHGPVVMRDNALIDSALIDSALIDSALIDSGTIFRLPRQQTRFSAFAGSQIQPARKYKEQGW